MIKKILIFMAILLAIPIFAQEGNSSPYSYYGIGLRAFRGTVENQAMGGLSILGDSVHVNLRNPAGFGALRLTNFTLGGSATGVNLESDEGTASSNSTTLDYVALGFPLSQKMGAGFGLQPYTSVDYKIIEEDGDSYSQFSGRGGTNKAFLTFGYEVAKGLRLGATANYFFGNVHRVSIRDDVGQQFAVQEINRSDVSGFSFDLGMQLERRLNERISFYGSAVYSPKASLDAQNDKDVSTVLFSREQNVTSNPIESFDRVTVKNTFNLPSQATLGLGFGDKNKWFAGAEYSRLQAETFTNPAFSLQDVNYDNAAQYRLGGFFVPRFNSITSYWQRVVYRAGVRFEETGLNVNGEGIDEFGISFGLGLPIGRAFNNVNLSFEYGQRGTTNAGLIKEDFFKVGLSLSLNDKWFVPFKFN